MKISALLPYFGSKRTLAPRIVAELGPHRSYWEPFCGSMAVLLAKPVCSQETVNDLYGDLVNLARVIRHARYGPALYRQLRRTMVHERLFAEAETIVRDAEYRPCADVVGPADAERAYQFFVACWLGRNGVIGTTKGSCGKQFSVRYTTNGGIQGTRFVSAVSSIPCWRRRISEVTILCRDGFKLLERIEDAEGTAIYCDPPYLAKGAEYIHDFEAGDHARLAGLLGRFRAARVVVSYYQHPALDKLYPGWTSVICNVTKSLVNQGRRGRESKAIAPEVLLVNGPSFTGKANVNTLFEDDNADII